MARLAGRITLIITCMALFSCAGAKSDLAAVNSGPLSGLPSIPMDVPGHKISDVHNAHINGSDALTKSSGALAQGTNLLLFTSETQPPAPPALEWGIYRYVPDGAQSEVVNTVDLGFTVDPGTSGWIAVANYGTGLWEFKGPYVKDGSTSKTFTGLDTVDATHDYTSPGGNLYFLVAAYNGTSISVSGLDVTSDVTPPQTFTISGSVTDSTTGDPLVDATVRLGLPANLTTQTDVNGNYSFTGLAAGNYNVSTDAYPGYGPFAPAGYPVSFPGDPGTGKDFSADLSGPAPVTYETGAGEIKALMDDRCVYCHSPDGGGPHTMPYLRNWSEVQPWASSIWVQVSNNFMPEPPKSLSASERAKFTDWKNNGYAQ